MKNNLRFSKAISWLTLAYFIILYAERAQSIFRILTDGTMELTGSAFDTFADIAVILSVLISLVMLCFCRNFFRSLAKNEAVPEYKLLSAAAGVALLGGMIHTEYTIPPIQFAAYGALIAAMAFRTAETAPAAKNELKLWYSLAYLTMFSMAIPVMYHSHTKLSTLYHYAAAIAAVVLVGCFTYMMRRVFTGDAEDLLSFPPLIIMVVLDAAAIGLRWNEEINLFALIFACITVVVFIVGKIMFAVRK